MNFHELDNFNLADAVKFHRRLNPRIWGSDEHLLPEVREKLLAIAADFQEFLGVDDLKVQDITLSGSNAAYSYTPHSDIDLHLVVEMPDDPVYQELFNAKKYQYNDEHDIRIDGVPVELYVQPADQKHVSQGIYSIKNGDWTQVPQRRRARIDDSCVQHKAADLDARIHAAVKSGDADAINRLWDRIKTMRQNGLEQNGEFGCENLAFKLLRNKGCIGRLKDAKTAQRDRELSLVPAKKTRKRMNYGMRDYWYPGTAYAGQDHPAGTESEQVDEGERKPDWTDFAVAKPNTNAAVTKPKVYAIGDSHGEGLSYTPGIINYAHGGQPSTSSSNYSGEYQGHPTGIDNVPDGSFVVISQGCNDAANSSRANLDSKGKIPLVSPETIANNVVRIVNAALAKRCKVVVVLFPNGDPNTRPYYGGPYQEKVRQAIRSAVGVPVVDLEGSPLDASGVHAVPSAYKAAGSKVLSIFQTINEASSGPGPDHLKKILHRFYDSCVDKLKLKNPPRLHLETTPDWSRENGSFGQYEPENNTLILATHGRHVLDILRTMAHEMTHRQQDEHEPLPADAGETGSPYEDQANAMAGRIMRQWAEEQPEMFDGATLEEASGYIPTRKQAKDPRFVMALTKDVRPGAVGKEANKLGLQTDSQGHPALLTAGLQKLLREFKEQDLFEIRMSPTSLRKEAAKTGALAGMEFEMIVPNTQSEDEYNQEPDYDADERASSPRDIRDFFYDGDFNSRRSVDSLIDSMMNDFSEWQSEEFDTRWESDSEEFIYPYIKDNMDDDEVRHLLDLEEEDPIGRQEYLLVADMIATSQIQPWYDNAQESAREEFYENDDAFEEWLSDAELAYMSDIERRYSGDITWPHYRSVSSGEGASVQETAESFSQAVGRPARASDSYHEYGQERPGPGKNFYVVEPDGSLSPDDSDDAGLEFVSPPLPIDEIMSDLNKVKKWADLNGCYTNDSTGLHINISVPNYDLDRLDYVKLALLMGDEYVLDQFGRASNTYAKSAMKKVRDHVQKRPYEAKYLLDKMKGHMGELASKAIHSGITDKYTSINTKDGHVEFRSPGGDWLGDNFSMIENTLLRFTVALSAAMDPKAYREEYLKKLYKILAPKDEKDPLAVFAKYAAGELPATALKSFVRQAQADRKAKKSGEDIVNGHRWRVSLKPELGGGVVEVMATDPIDAKKQAIIQQPNWKFVDDSALTITRLDEPAAGASTTQPHPEGRGRPNDPNGRLAIVNRDDPLVFAYGRGTPSPAPDYLFRFTLPDGYSQAQLRAVMAAWAARQNANAADYMVVDTTQFLPPEPSAAPEAGSVQWNINNRNNETVHTFWNRNVQRDANAAAHEWLMANDELPSVDMQGPFDVVPAAIPGSTLDLQRQRQQATALPQHYEIIRGADQGIASAFIAANDQEARARLERYRQEHPGTEYNLHREGQLIAGQDSSQRQAADVAANTRRWADYEASQAATPTPVPGVQDIDIEIPPAQTQWEVYDRNTGQPVFRMYAENQAAAWRKGQEWVANYARMTPDQEINAANYSVRQSAQPVTEGKVKLHTDPDYFGAEIDNSGFDSLPVIDIPTHKLVGFEPDDKMNQPKSQANVKKIVAGLKKGNKLPPILVRKHNRGYQVLDGHHRFYAYKLLGIKSIPARIVPDKDIEEIGKKDVTEGRKSKIIVKPSPGKGNGLFATKLIKAGEVITSSKFEHISDKDWQLIKNTTPVKLYGFKLGDKHALQSGPFKFKFTDQKEKALWDKTEFKGLSLSGFMFVNGADSPDEVNSKERFSNNTAEMIATQDIQPGQEIIKQYNVPTTGVTEGRENDRISFQVQKGKNRFATAMKVNDQQVGVYQYNANTGRSVAEVYPEFKGKGLGKLLVLHAIYTAAQLGLDFQEDESRTSAYDNVLDSLSSNGYIVDDDGRWYVTGKGEQYLTQSVKQGVTEGRENDNPVAQKIFFARSDKAPDGWSYDHVGFITQDGRQIQMSGHKGNDVYVTNTVTDDPEFPKQKIKIVSLSKPVSVPTSNTVGAENCGTFVAKVLQANGIKGIDTQKLYSVFKGPQGQVRAPAHLPDHTFNHEQGYHPGPTPPQIKPMQIAPSMIKEQGVAESREITKLHKLDSVLEKCIEMIRRGHESDPEKYGRVAACVIDNKNNHTYAINMPGPDGTRRHAERMAIDKHLQRHGRIGPNAIMITTLSPCVNHMDERYGESCTDLLADYGIEKCYAGWQDPTQHPAEDYPFNLQVTNNADIFNTCRDIAASFLPQAMAEAYDGPPMKFLRPGELSGSYSPQQMQAMGFKQSANGSWYIPMNTWQRLVSGGQIREGAAGPLASMVSQDQDERNEYKQFVQSKAGGDWDKGAQMYAQLKGRPSDDIFGDSANQDRFMKMIFDFDTFTEDDWHNYWLMAQHCDKNRDFQRQALAAIEKYQGQDHQNYHYLADRISCGTTGTQKYGTQDGCNIDSVNENFADGRHPEDKGDSKRHHVPTKASVSSLRKFAKNHSGRAAQLAHWMANMKSGRAKKK